MAIGAYHDQRSNLMRAPKRGPQSFLTGLLAGDVHAWTKGSPRAAELSIIPKRSRTYFAGYRPGSAQRIPPLVNTGYGSDYATDENVRKTLVARARIFRASLAAGPAKTVAPAAAVPAGTSQARRAAGVL